MFEHRLYLPSAGFFIATTAAAALLLRRFKTGGPAAYLLAAVVCILLGGLTLARNRLWNNQLDLWRDAVTKTPHSALATANLGGAYLSSNMPEKTLPLLLRALELKPNLDANSKICLGRTLKALGVDGKRFTTGEEFVQPGTAMTIGGPGYGTLTDWESVLMNNMALGYEYLGHLDKAADAVGIAVWLRPAYDKGWYNLGVIALKRGDRNHAGEALAQLRGLNPALARDLVTVMNPEKAVSRKAR
jgi:tetratricopeptide (TPR) repeat protein